MKKYNLINSTEEKKTLKEELNLKHDSSSNVDEVPISGKTAFDEEAVKRKGRMSKIRHKIAVISGKGGVGKRYYYREFSNGICYTWLRQPDRDT